MKEPTPARAAIGTGTPRNGGSGQCPFHAGMTGPAEPHPATVAGQHAPAATGTPAQACTPAPADTVARQTLIWVQRAVVGLNLCPFANAVLKKERLRIQVSEASTTAALLDELRNELNLLLSQPESTLETSLLVCPRMLHDFLDFNDFLNEADALLQQMDLEGIVQLASFHPHYQFAGTRPDDIDNATNQSPWPTLHLLRESSIDRAVASMGDETNQIFENNIARLRGMGRQGWLALQACWQSPDDVTVPHHGNEGPSSGDGGAVSVPAPDNPAARDSTPSRCPAHALSPKAGKETA